MGDGGQLYTISATTDRKSQIGASSIARPREAGVKSHASDDSARAPCASNGPHAATAVSTAMRALGALGSAAAAAAAAAARGSRERRRARRLPTWLGGLGLGLGFGLGLGLG